MVSKPPSRRLKVPQKRTMAVTSCSLLDPSAAPNCEKLSSQTGKPLFICWFWTQGLALYHCISYFGGTVSRYCGGGGVRAVEFRPRSSYLYLPVPCIACITGLHHHTWPLGNLLLGQTWAPCLLHWEKVIPHKAFTGSRKRKVKAKFSEI
jgi:hypothetical protein